MTHTNPANLHLSPTSGISDVPPQQPADAATASEIEDDISDADFFAALEEVCNHIINSDKSGSDRDMHEAARNYTPPVEAAEFGRAESAANYGTSAGVIYDETE